MTDQEKSRLARKLGALGASEGGIARAKTLSAEQRQEIARQGGIASGMARKRKTRETAKQTVA